MQSLLDRYRRKLEEEKIAVAGRAALAALDDEPVVAGPADLTALGRAILAIRPAAALVLFEPAPAFRAFLVSRLAKDAERIVPDDTESRTFLHDIPVVRCRAGRIDPVDIAAALGRRRGLLVEGVGIVAIGALTVEQAYVNAASIGHALTVLYLVKALTGGICDPAEAAAFATFRREATAAPATGNLIFRSGPLVTAPEILAEMERTGRYTVACGLVDSFFGNISCSDSEQIWISQTAAPLDALEGVIDPVPFDDSTTLAITASSELAAHRRIYEVTGARTILHGHPRFAVTLSLLCPERSGCPVADCWRDCLTPRTLCGTPVVAGEVGAGGLAKRVPPVIGATGSAIVYGHGVFSIGTRDFAEAFARLAGIEHRCRAEYFRRFDAKSPCG